MPGYTRRLPTSLRSSLILSLKPDLLGLNLFDGHNGTRAFVNAWGSTSWSIRVNYAVKNQNRALYKAIRRTLADYWDFDHVTNALKAMIFYGMYAWMQELLNECPLLVHTTTSRRDELLAQALRLRDPIVVELLLANGAKISNEVFQSTVGPEGYATVGPNFATFKNRLVFTGADRDEVMAILHPLAEKYNIQDQYLIQ